MKVYWHDRKSNIHIKADDMEEFEKAMLEEYELNDVEELFRDGREVMVMAGIKGIFMAYLKGKTLGDAYARFLDLEYNEVEQK